MAVSRSCRRPMLGPIAGLLCVLPLGGQATAPDTTRLGDLVVTATRAATSAAIPAATTVLRGDELRARGIHLVQDALREVPGIVVVQAGSYGAVTSIFLRGGESDYVKVLLDGVPLNLPGGSLNLADLTTDDLDRIEVVRGPVSVLYGADAMSGVIQLFTRSGAGRPNGSLAYRGGSLGGSGVDGRVAGGLSNTSLSLAASRVASDGSYYFNSRYLNRTGSARLGWRDQAHGHLDLTIRGSDVAAGYPTDLAGVARDRNQETTERRLSLGLIGTRALGGNLTGTIQGFASRLRAGASNRPDTQADTLGYGFDSDRVAITWRRGLDARLDYRRSGEATISFAVGIEQEEIAATSRVVENYGYGESEGLSAFAAERTTRHLDAQLIAVPHRSLSLQLGVRVDDNTAFGTSLTSRAGASLQLTPATRVWGAVGTAFKAPTFAELFAADPFEVGNPALDPERTITAELAASQIIGLRAKLEATAFSQHFRDLIQYVGAGPGRPTYTNIGAASSRGIEASLSFPAAAMLTVRAHWTWLATEVSDSGAASSLTFLQGARLLRRPASSGGLTAILRHPLATLTGTLLHIGGRDDVDYRDFPATRTALPSYTIVDLSLEFPVRRAGGGIPAIDLAFRGENVLDAAFDQVVGFPGRGRILFAGGQLRY